MSADILCPPLKAVTPLGEAASAPFPFSNLLVLIEFTESIRSSCHSDDLYPGSYCERTSGGSTSPLACGPRRASPCVDGGAEEPPRAEAAGSAGGPPPPPSTSSLHLLPPPPPSTSSLHAPGRAPLPRPATPSGTLAHTRRASLLRRRLRVSARDAAGRGALRAAGRSVGGPVTSRRGPPWEETSRGGDSSVSILHPPSARKPSISLAMALLWAPLLSALLLWLRPPTQAYPSCPLGCRCYSLTVECGSTGLQHVPRHIPPSTQTIFLQDNVIAHIRRQDMTLLRHLHYLYLQNNSISAVEPGSFQNQAQLLELALNGNRIHLVSADMFHGLEHLRILYLAGNDITRLMDYTFRGLQRLQELHLQHNSIEVVADQALVGLTSLALLDLSRNNLHTIGPASLRPLVSLQVLRITDNPWRCDCALHWLRSWIDEEGQRLLSSAERRLVCTEPPRLSHLSLVEVPLNSLVCIPPLVQLEPRRLAVRLGESLRVSCHASGYPRPQVTWRKASQGKVVLSPRGLVQELGAAGGGGGVGGEEPSEGGGVGLQKSDGERFDPDTGSGMLFLSNVTVAHAGFYECEAWNAGGVARVTFQLAINSSTSSSSSSSSSIWASWSQASSPYSPVWPRLRNHGPSPGSDVSREPLYALGSMAFSALGAATQTAIAVGISLLALTALLLVAMIYSRHQHREKEADGAEKEESILYVNDYSDGPTTFAQLEEYRDERGHEMYVLNRAKPVLPPAPPTAVSTSSVGCAAPSDSSSHTMSSGAVLPTSPTLAPNKQQQPEEEEEEDEEEEEGDIRTMRRMAGEGGEAEPVITSEAEGMFLNHTGLFMDSQIAYEIHC